MHIKLEDFREDFNLELARFFDLLPPELFEGSEIKQTLSEFCQREGKRIRPYLLYESYLLFQGQDHELALHASILPELTHNFLLIHADVMDRDRTRRGSPTGHESYTEQFPGPNASRFGDSMATIAGMLLQLLSNDLVAELNVSTEKRLRIWKVMSRAIRMTLLGQELDLENQKRLDLSDHLRVKIARYKTAYYSIEAPLHIGAILADAEDGYLSILSSFAIPYGVLFQLRDDIEDEVIRSPSIENLVTQYSRQSHEALRQLSLVLNNGASLENLHQLVGQTGETQSA